MSFPAGVQLRQVTFGVPFALANGDDLIMEVTFTPTRSMVWAATGAPGIARSYKASNNVGLQGSISLPVTDQAGWLDGLGNSLSVASGGQTHLYLVEVLYKDPNGTVIAKAPTRNLPLPAGDLTPIDLDLLIPVSTTAGVALAVPDTWSAQVSAAQAAAAAAEAAASTAEPAGLSTDTRASLSGTYVAHVAAAGSSGFGDNVLIQQAHDALPTAGGTLRLGLGDYTLNTGVTFTKPTRLIGEGMGKAGLGGTRLISTSLTGYAVTFNADGCSAQDLQVANDLSGTPTAGAGLYFQRGGFISVRDVLIQGFYDNLRMDHGYYYVLDHVVSLDPVRYGMWVRNTVQTDHGDQLITGCVITPYGSARNPTSGIRWESGGGLKVIGNKINSGAPQPDGNGAAGRFGTGIDIAVADGVSTSVVLVEGNSVEGWTSGGIVVGLAGTAGAATGTLNKVVITGNEVAANGAGTAIAVNPNTAGKVNNVVVGQNVISDAGTGLLFQNIDTLYVAPNTMRTVGGALYLLGGISDEQIDQQIVTGEGIDLYNTQSAADTGHRVAMQQKTLTFGREVPTTTSTSIYTTLYRFSMPNYSSALIDVTIAGNVNGLGPAVISAKRTFTRGNANALTAHTVGTDVYDGFNGTAAAGFDLLFDTAAVSGEVQLKVRLNSTLGGSDLNGRVKVAIDGYVTAVHKGP